MLEAKVKQQQHSIRNPPKKLNNFYQIKIHTGTQAAQTWGKYDEQLKTKDRLLGENETIKEETKALMAQLEKEQGNLSIYHDKVFFVKKQIFCLFI